MATALPKPQRFLEKLHSPFGMALVGSDFYVANADAIVRFPYTHRTTRITHPRPRSPTCRPAINHHWTKNIIASRDGKQLYATVGSTAMWPRRAWRSRSAAPRSGSRSCYGQKRLFASGLRNPNGLGGNRDRRALDGRERTRRAWQRSRPRLPHVGEGGRLLWLAIELLGPHVDERVKPPRPDLVAKASHRTTRWAHVAPLGMAFSDAAHARAASPAASSSASTAPGTASPTAATR